MAVSQELLPIAITDINLLAPNNVSYLQDPLDATDTKNIGATNSTSAPYMQIKFESIKGNLTGTQTVKFVYEDANWVGVHIVVYDGANAVYTSPITYNGYSNIIVSFSFDADLLTDKTGANLTVRFVAHVWQGVTINYFKACRFVANYEPTVDYLSGLKTDWTAEDYYNFADLNRVEGATQQVIDKVNAFRAANLTLTIIKDRTQESIEFADSLQRIEGNIELVAWLLYKPSGYTNPKGWTYNSPFSYEDANRIEQNLFILNRYVEGNLTNLKYAGAYTVGDIGVIY